MCKSVWTDLKRKFTLFNSDRSGMALVYITIALPVIVSLGVLAVDLGRLATLQSSLQHGADALALAGAGELDRRPDAITRANLAIANLVTSNVSLFGASVVTIDETAVTVRYFSAIPGHGTTGDDASPMPSGSGLNPATASDNAVARFVEVTVTPKLFNTVLPATYYGGSNTRNANATAVAGFDAAVCNFTPMFICNPFEPTGNTDVARSTEIFAHVNSARERRRQIELRRGPSSGNSPWSPGNYGLLRPPTDPDTNSPQGVSAIKNMIATAVPKACFVQNGVLTKPGFAATVKDSINVRFDIFDGGGYTNDKSNVDYRPARNVRKGYFINGNGNACNKQTLSSNAAQYMGLPRDACMIAGNCTLGGGRVGDMNWNFDSYWSVNNFTGTKPNGANGGAAANAGNNQPSRYDMYRFEIDNNLITRRGKGTNGTNGEAGVPNVCFQNQTVINDSPDRRILYAAILNCKAPPGLSSGSSQDTPYVVAAFGKFFITEPVAGSQDSLFAELIGVVEPPGGAYSVARDMVQLYR